MIPLYSVTFQVDEDSFSFSFSFIFCLGVGSEGPILGPPTIVSSPHSAAFVDFTGRGHDRRKAVWGQCRTTAYNQRLPLLDNHIWKAVERS